MPRLKIPARFVVLGFGIFEKQEEQEYKRVPKKQTTTLALSVDQLAPGYPDVKWHSAALNAGWLSLTGYYCVPAAPGPHVLRRVGGRALQARHQ